MSLSGKGSQPKSGLQYDFTYTWGWIGFVQGKRLKIISKRQCRDWIGLNKNAKRKNEIIKGSRAACSKRHWGGLDRLAAFLFFRAQARKIWG